MRLWIVSAPAMANAFPHPGKSQVYGSVEGVFVTKSIYEQRMTRERTFLRVPTHVLL